MKPQNEFTPQNASEIEPKESNLFLDANRALAQLSQTLMNLFHPEPPEDFKEGGYFNFPIVKNLGKIEQGEYIVPNKKINYPFD